MERDLKNSIKTVSVLHEDAAGASTVGAIIDTSGFESLTYAVTSGTITTGTFSATFQESDSSDMSGATTVNSDLVIGAIAFAVTDDDESQSVGIVGKKRYQRMTLVGASTPVAEMSATAILGHSAARPVA